MCETIVARGPYEFIMFGAMDVTTSFKFTCFGDIDGPKPYEFIGFQSVRSAEISAELSHSLKVSDRRRNTPKSAQNRSELGCAGLWVPCRICWAWFGPALGPNPVRHRRFPAESLQVFGALLAQPRSRWAGSASAMLQNIPRHSRTQL